MPLSDLLVRGASEWESAMVFALLSAISYDGEPGSRRHRFLQMGFEVTGEVDERIARWRGIDAYFLDHADDLVIVFRGSQESIDWFQNIRAGKRPFDQLHVHRGFAEAAEAFRIEYARHAAIFENARGIWLAGHSLGGALAQLVAYDLARRGHDIVKVTTFGSPRVGGILRWRMPYRAIGLGEVTSRWVNADDPIARIPFFVPAQLPDSDWAHTGPQNFIDLENRRVEFGDDRVLWPPTRIRGDVAHHAISGFGEGEYSGYIRNIYRFMPTGARQRLQLHARPSLSDCLKIFDQLTKNEERTMRLRAFNEQYHEPMSLADIGVQFR